MRKRKLTPTQETLLQVCKQYTGPNNPIKYDTLKSLCLEHVKSFDGSFNALIDKGYFERVETNDYSNQFKITL